LVRIVDARLARGGRAVAERRAHDADRLERERRKRGHGPVRADTTFRRDSVAPAPAVVAPSGHGRACRGYATRNGAPMLGSRANEETCRLTPSADPNLSP